MLDSRFIRQNIELVTQQLARRGFVFDQVQFEAFDNERRTAEAESQELLTSRNQAAKKVGELIKQGMNVDQAKAEVAATLETIDANLESVKERAKVAAEALDNLLLAVPNIPHDSVPNGKDENDNVEVSRWGTPATFDFPVKDHVDLGEALGGLDFDTASKITGSRFMLLRGQLARVHRALIQFMLDTHIEQHGYQEVYVPYLVNRESLRGTGQLPKFEEDLFKLQGEQEYYLIPTAEVPVTNMARDMIFDDQQFGEHGLKFVCHTPCFRSEAGSYGRDTRGMIRQHQFEKVELVQMVRPDQSAAALEVLTGHAETILQKLELPYRKMALCVGDMGFSSCKTYDLEVWLPAQGKYREISSCSTFGDFQARRMQARWRNPATNKPELLHTLNGSGLAIGRTLVAILENGQQADGSVMIPAALRSYLGGLERLQK
jgi:seryl-tRNA synthetase